MAKQKDVEPVVAPTPPAPPENPTPVDGVTPGSTPPQPPASGDTSDEVAQLKKRIAELEAQTKSQASTIAAIDPNAPKRKFRVQLQDGPKWVVEAAHPSLAWDAYCSQVGVLGSIHQPTIVQVDDSHPLGQVQ